MKVLAGTLALGGILAFLAACEYTPHDSPADLARSHERVLGTIMGDIDAPRPPPVDLSPPVYVDPPVYSTGHSAAELLSTEDPELDLSCEEIRAEVGPFARRWARQSGPGAWQDDEFSFSFKSCEF